MKHLGTKQLETSRLILRPFTMDDAPAMFTNWASEPEVTRYLTWPTHTGVDVSEKVLANWVSHYIESDYYQWAIVLKETGELVGGISVVHRNDDVASVHIGYCIGTRWWHQGITGEALGELLRFFFEEVGVNRVDSRHDPRNPHSGMVMAHCGMTMEGTMRQADRNNQGICDYTMYGILKSDYFSRSHSLPL